MRPRAFAWLLLTAIADAAAATAQEISSSPSVVAIRLTEGDRIDVDGRLDEPIWQRASPATDFAQLDPQNRIDAALLSDIIVRCA